MMAPKETLLKKSAFKMALFCFLRQVAPFYENPLRKLLVTESEPPKVPAYTQLFNTKPKNPDIKIATALTARTPRDAPHKPRHYLTYTFATSLQLIEKIKIHHSSFFQYDQKDIVIKKTRHISLKSLTVKIT